MGIKIEDCVGQKFNRLTVLSVFSRGYTNSTGRWVPGRLLVQCDCGTVKSVAASLVTSGGTKSCGCLAREATISRNTTHGLRKDPLYQTWADIRRRMLNPTDKNYPMYGGRNLKLEPEWVDNFAAFHAWVIENLGPKPSKKHSLDRADNDLGYLKGNLRWATPIEQGNNRRDNRMLTFRGLTATMKQQCEVLGLAYRTVIKRLIRGWSEERALSTPTNLHPQRRHPRTSRSLKEQPNQGEAR